MVAFPTPRMDSGKVNLIKSMENTYETFVVSFAKLFIFLIRLILFYKFLIVLSVKVTQKLYIKNM